MIDVSHFYRAAYFHFAAVWLFFTGNHFKQGGFTRAVRAYDADNGTGWHAKAQVVHQQTVFKGFAYAIEFDDLVTQTLARRDENLLCFIAFLVFRVGHFLITG